MLPRRNSRNRWTRNVRKQSKQLPGFEARRNWLLRRALLLFVILSVAALSARADVLKITVDDTIQPISAEFIARAIDKASADHDSALLIQLRTPGGLETSTRDIIQKILASPVPVIVYVAPSG